MNLPNCDNFCTAEKCLELEQKITDLQFQLDELRLLVNQHISQDIPTAHDYTPLVLVESFIENNNILTTSITIDDINDFDQVNLPIHQESNLSLSGSFESEILTLTVADGESQDSTQINIPLPEIPEYKKSNLSLSGSFQSEILTLTVADGESQDSTQITIPLPEISELEQCDLSINGSYLNEIITITYSYCNGTNSFQILIPLGDTINNYGGGGGNLECPNIETKIEVFSG